MCLVNSRFFLSASVNSVFDSTLCIFRRAQLDGGGGGVSLNKKSAISAIDPILQWPTNLVSVIFQKMFTLKRA